MIKFIQNACLKSYIDMNTDARKKAKKGFEKTVFKLANNAVFEKKTMENVRKHRDIILVTAERKGRNYLLSEPNYHTTNCFKQKICKP